MHSRRQAAVTAHVKRPDQPTLVSLRVIPGSAGRAILKMKVSVVWIAEERTLGEVAVDAVLVFDAADPVATLVAIDVAAAHSDL